MYIFFEANAINRVFSSTHFSWEEKWMKRKSCNFTQAYPSKLNLTCNFTNLFFLSKIPVFARKNVHGCITLILPGPSVSQKTRGTTFEFETTKSTRKAGTIEDSVEDDRAARARVSFPIRTRRSRRVARGRSRCRRGWLVAWGRRSRVPDGVIARRIGVVGR